jgi:serine/threonine protein kinase
VGSGTKQQPLAGPRSADVEVLATGEAALVAVKGLVDERFTGFGEIGEPHALVIDVSAMVRMTSFGVRQWRRALDALPKSITNLYLLGCQTFFVDQLNMVLNFGGHAEVLTAMAPYTCTACGTESSELIDIHAQRPLLLKAGVPEKHCPRCQAKLELDEAPESYFSFVGRYTGSSSLDPAAAELLVAHGLYTAVDAAGAGEKPPRIIKIVQGAVTYFRIIGTIGSMFRARPFLVGAEGECVIDLAEVDRVDSSGIREWRRLLKILASQVPAVTLVDVGESLLLTDPGSFSQSRNIGIWSVLIPYRCADCGRARAESRPLEGKSWPYTFADEVCPTCGGTTSSTVSADSLAPLQKAATDCPPDSAKLIRRRNEVVSRALTDANVAQAGASLSNDETILGKYKIVRRLSSGGMAEVFLAKQIGIGGFEKPVALKRIQRKLLEKRHLAIDMFLNEAKIAGRLTHPNIVQVLDVGEVGGELYLAMEFVHGRDLREIARRLQVHQTTLPLGTACFIVSEIAQALHHAYWSTDLEGNRLAVVHRDVSPHNVILGYDGTVKLLDFGVAMSSVTEQESMIVGKWMYMSPEATTNKAVDHRSDLFSLGVITYLLCTGAMPFTGTEAKKIVAKIRSGQYKPMLEQAPDLPPELGALVSRMLAPSPQERPQNGLEIVRALNEIMRTHALESSAADIAYLLTTFFPESGGDGEQISLPADWRDASPSVKRKSTSFSLSRSVRRSTPDVPALHSTNTVDPTTIDPPKDFQTPLPMPITAPTPTSLPPPPFASRTPPPPSLPDLETIPSVRPDTKAVVLGIVLTVVVALVCYGLVRAVAS